MGSVFPNHVGWEVYFLITWAGIEDMESEFPNHVCGHAEMGRVFPNHMGGHGEMLVLYKKIH